MYKKIGPILAASAVLSLAVFLGGCIVSDEVCTVAISPDGSADVVIVRSNVRSSESGEKAQEELRGYVNEFNARRDPEQMRLIEAGGELREARWIHEDYPYANYISVRLPTAAAFEKAFTFNEENGQTLASARFTRSGTRRKFLLEVNRPGSNSVELTAEKTVAELRVAQASGLSETRFALVQGQIVASSGFTVAGDRQSALLEPKVILEALKTNAKFQAFLEWELSE